MKKIGIVDQGDFISWPIGGSTTFLRTVIPGLSQYFDVYLYGTSRARTHYRRWTANYVGSIPFWGFRHFSAHSTLIPERIKSILLLALSRKQILSQNLDILYIHQPELMLSLMGKRGPKKVLHLHGLANPASISRMRFYRNACAEAAYDCLFTLTKRHADLILSVSRPGTQPVRELDLRFPNQFECVPICVDDTLFHPSDPTGAKQSLGLAPDTKVLGYVGRLSKNKGLNSALRLLMCLHEQRKNVVLLVVGDGEERRNLEDRIRSLDLMHAVMMTGAKEYEDLPRYYNAMDIFILASGAEGFPMVILEALSCGVPVIAGDVGSIRSVVKADYNGFLVDWANMEEAVACARTIFDRRHEMSEAARGSVSQFRGAEVAEVIARSLLNCCEKTTGGSHR